MFGKSFLHHFFGKGTNHLSRALNAEGRGVYDYVVVIVFAPFVACVEIIIGRAALIGFVDKVDYLRGLNLGVARGNSFLAVVKVAEDENAKNVWLIS